MGIARWAVCIWLVLPLTARADDVVAMRLDSGLTLGSDLRAFDMGFGADFDVFVDGLGFRLGGTVGLVDFAQQGKAAWRAMRVPEISMHLQDNDSRLRVYTSLQPALMSYRERLRYDGLRIGPEVELRAGVTGGGRLRLGLFYGVVRDVNFDFDFATVGFRLSVEYGVSTEAAPKPLPGPRCDDDSAPIPGVGCKAVAQ